MERGGKEGGEGDRERERHRDTETQRQRQRQRHFKTHWNERQSKRKQISETRASASTPTGCPATMTGRPSTPHATLARAPSDTASDIGITPLHVCLWSGILSFRALHICKNAEEMKMPFGFTPMSGRTCSR